MAPKLQVAFRADASQAMGTGHVRRCLALSQALNSFDAKTLFVCRRHDEVSEHALPSHQASVWLGPPDLNEPVASDVRAVDDVASAYASWGLVRWQQDADETIAALLPSPPHWLVVDHYAWDARWHRRVSKTLGCKIMVIDDLGDRPLAADLLLDQNLHSDHLAKYANCLDPDQAKTRFLFGPRYALLSAHYAKARKYVFSEQVRSIGIFMGGTDPDDLSSKALRACREVAKFQGDVVLVSSSISPHHAKRQALATRWPHTTIVSDLPDLETFFASHDLQIGCGGGAAWERCCIGAPTVACELAANQQAVLPRLSDLGAVILAQPTASLDFIKPLGEVIALLLSQPDRRKQLAQHATRLVDGKGSMRAAAVLALSVQADIFLRPAELVDEQLLLEWANDPSVRHQAFDSGQISEQTHAVWLRRKLAKHQNCVLLIGVAANGLPVGQVRFDQVLQVDHRGEIWQIDYSLGPCFRGHGLGKLLLAKAMKELSSNRNREVEVQAQVKATNLSSLKTFRALGFFETQIHLNNQVCSNFLLTIGNDL